jgi:hypothetical protein
MALSQTLKDLRAASQGEICGALTAPGCGFWPPNHRITPPPVIFSLVMQTKDFSKFVLGRPLHGAWTELARSLDGPRTAQAQGHPTSAEGLQLLGLANCQLLAANCFFSVVKDLCSSTSQSWQFAYYTAFCSPRPVRNRTRQSPGGPQKSSWMPMSALTISTA